MISNDWLPQGSAISLTVNSREGFQRVRVPQKSGYLWLFFNLSRFPAQLSLQLPHSDPCVMQIPEHQRLGD
jgi:hypothetical protein